MADGDVNVGQSRLFSISSLDYFGELRFSALALQSFPCIIRLIRGQYTKSLTLQSIACIIRFFEERPSGMVFGFAEIPMYH